ncbi:MAG: hypothetical protein Kow0029_10750 [Candidatus Rifleibacteriota bacterium]
MVKQQRSTKGRWLLLLVLAMASIVFTGCEKGSLGVKGGTATGFVIDSDNNQPISDVLVRASGGSGHQTLSTYTSGDGSYIFHDMDSGQWTFNIEKYGYTLANQTGTDTTAVTAAEATVNNGETVVVPTIKLSKTFETIKGTLKGYPIDAITGRPLRNFTVSNIGSALNAKTKLFETADDFKEVGFTGLPGGNWRFRITCPNYNDFETQNEILIGGTPYDLGVVELQPHKISISGTLRNLPGYVLEAQPRDIVVWAEAAGKVVASYTDPNITDAFKGSITYKLDGIPATAGSVAIKCKIRGYDLLTINSAVSIPNTIPGGVIGSIDADFTNIEPIKRDLRVVVTGSAPTDQRSSFEPGDICRIYIQQGGKDIVPYTDVVSVNYRAEGYISGVITGYPINVLAVNMTAGYYKVLSQPITIQENSNSAYTIEVSLQ